MRLRPDGYPINWATVSTHIKFRSNWRCVRCGHDHEAPGPGNRKPCTKHCDLSRHPEVIDCPETAAEIERLILEGYGPDFWPAWPMQRQRVLTVHHLDGDKTNLAWWNLAALCQVCHLSVQGRVDLKQAYMLEHSDWFKPYIAGYYAWRYLGKMLSRSKIDSRLDELLALERRL